VADALVVLLLVAEAVAEDSAAVGLAEVGALDGALEVGAEEAGAALVLVSDEQAASAPPAPPTSVTSPAARSTLRRLAGAAADVESSSGRGAWPTSVMFASE
jgi:hypothetical protein